MTTYAIEEQKLTNIADAIRSKTGGVDTLSVDEMVTEIEGISTGAGEVSWNDLTDKPFYETEPVETVLADNVIVTTSDNSSQTQNDPIGFKVEEGVEYTVIFNGVEYLCVGTKDDWGGAFIGSRTLWYYEPYNKTEEPFAYGNGWFMTAVDGTYTVSIFATLPEVHKIDGKYLDYESSEFRNGVKNAVMFDEAYLEVGTTKLRDICPDAQYESKTIGLVSFSDAQGVHSLFVFSSSFTIYNGVPTVLLSCIQTTGEEGLIRFEVAFPSEDLDAVANDIKTYKTVIPTEKYINSLIEAKLAAQ